MRRLDPQTRQILCDTVLDEKADRGDRRYSLETLLSDGMEARATLTDIATRCRDPFFSGLARAWVNHGRLLEGTSGLAHVRMAEALG